MKFRLGLIVGFALGYYLGAMAGRERYEQLNRYLRKARRSDAFETAVDKTKAVVDLGVERAKDLVDNKVNGHSGPVAVPGTTPVSKSL
ncbi:MAG: hypothetical protein H0W70_12085 [Actinobacteria bacterium]|nr:hypothetical protein [Actinomycetota bacterium]